MQFYVVLMITESETPVSEQIGKQLIHSLYSRVLPKHPVTFFQLLFKEKPQEEEVFGSLLRQHPGASCFADVKTTLGIARSVRSSLHFIFSYLVFPGSWKPATGVLGNVQWGRVIFKLSVGHGILNFALPPWAGNKYWQQRDLDPFQLPSGSC